MHGKAERNAHVQREDKKRQVQILKRVVGRRKHRKRERE